MKETKCEVCGLKLLIPKDTDNLCSEHTHKTGSNCKYQDSLCDCNNCKLEMGLGGKK